MIHLESSNLVKKEEKKSFKDVPQLYVSKLMEKTIRRMINSKSARDAYVRAEVSTFLAYQIRSLRNQRGWSQKELAEKLKTKQSFISKIEDPSYGKVSLETLFLLSQAFDVGLQVKFISLVSMVKSTYFPKYSEREVVPFDEESKLVSYYTSKIDDSSSPIKQILDSISCELKSGRATYHDAYSGLFGVYLTQDHLLEREPSFVEVI